MTFDDNFLLIQELKSGNEKAYVFLVNKFHRKLYVYTLSLTNDHATAEDIVQEVFIKTWEFRKKLNSKFSIQGFLYRTAYNSFINIYRRNQSIMALEKAYMEALHITLEDSNASDLEKKILIITKEIDKLPKKCRKTFLLSKQDGLTNIEIAEHLNISIKSVEKHITKAYSILRKKIGVKADNLLFLLFRRKQYKIV